MSDETAIVVAPGKAIAERLTKCEIEGMGVDPKVLGGQFQRLRIQHAIRSQKDAGGVPGQWRLGDRYLTNPRFVILKNHSFRSLAEAENGDDKKTRTVCGSADTIQPLPTLQYPRHTNCPDCAYAQWTDGPNNKRVPPPCKDGIALFGLLPDEDDTPCWILAQGFGAFTAVKELLQSFRSIRGLKSMAQPVIGLSSKEERNNGVIYYNPVFTVETTRFEGSDELVAKLLPVEHYIDAVRAAVRDVWHEPFVRESAPPEDAAAGSEPVIDVTPEKDPAWQNDLPV